MASRILVVDDEPHIVQVVSLKLRNAGYEVITAADGEEALELALSGTDVRSGADARSGMDARSGADATAPALIITDLQMPYMTGLELCKALRRHAATASIPVVMLTARGYTLDDDDLASGNIRKVLSKPFSPRAVLQLVEQLLQESGGGSRVPSGCEPTSEAA